MDLNKPVKIERYHSKILEKCKFNLGSKTVFILNKFVFLICSLPVLYVKNTNYNFNFGIIAFEVYKA